VPDFKSLYTVLLSLTEHLGEGSTTASYSGSPGFKYHVGTSCTKGLKDFSLSLHANTRIELNIRFPTDSRAWFSECFACSPLHSTGYGPRPIIWK
jgi:hypothetical protein